MRTSATGQSGGASRRGTVGLARQGNGRGRLNRKIAQLRRTPSGTPLRLRNWSLRTKLLAVLLIPTLTSLVLIAVHFDTQLRAANRLSELSAQVTADRSMAGLVHALQRERDLTVHFVAMGRTDGHPEMIKQRERVDVRQGAFSKAVTAAKPELSDDAASAMDRVQARLGVLKQLRYGAQHTKHPADTVLRSYGGLISALLAARGQSVVTISEPELVRHQLAGIALARAKEQTSVTRAVVGEALVVGELTLSRKRTLVAANSDIEAWRNDFVTFATTQQRQMYDDRVAGTLKDDRDQILEGVLARSDSGRPLAGMDRAKWDNAATFTANLMREVEEALLAQMQARTDTLAAEARTSALRDGAIVLVLLLLAGLLAFVIGRSLIRPLRTLRSTALEVAEYRLPAAVHGLLANPKGPRKTTVAPVPVTSTEEVGQVARAFDAVHGEAVRLAAEQAELRQNVNTMFLNLARRSQELADRQLDVLDRMEAEEVDSDRLARLFELDHLATRSRRVAENLLVLTGNDFARMLPGSIAASEVIAAALSEIEHYQRVQLSAVPEIAVRGDVVSDVVHVISELLENATNTPGDKKPVSVVSSMNRDGNWLVEITDNGAGMSDEEIDTANARLADPPEIDVEASRRMGLYVIARLARRNGLEVRLRHAPSGGLTASVLVPSKLVGDLPAGAERVDPGKRPDWLETASKRQAARAARVPPPAAPPKAAGPPKRAPIERRPEPAGATAEPKHPLEDDQPTERMPAYRDLLTKWFERPETTTPGAPPEPAPDQHLGGEVPPEPGPDEHFGGEVPREPGPDEHFGGEVPRELAPDVPPAAPAPEPAFAQLESDMLPGPPVPPRQRGTTEAELLEAKTVKMTRRQHAAKGVISPAPVNPVVPGDYRGHAGNLDQDDAAHAVRSSGQHRAVEDPLDLVSSGRTGQRPPAAGPRRAGPISRAPDAVRRRMLSLADGRRRARHASGAEYADPGQSATVGAGRQQWPEPGAGVGGKERR